MIDRPEAELGTDRAARDGADFAPQRIGGGRRTPPLLAWVVALAGVVAVGFAGRAGGFGGTAGESAAPSSAAPAILGEAADQGGDGPPPTPPTRGNPRVSSDDGPIRLELVRTTASIFVHADVHANHVAWVFVQVQTDSGRVAGWASLSFPNSVDPPDGDQEDDKPALRFDVELVIPEDMRAGRLWTQVNVYDNLSQRVATTRLAVPARPTETLGPEFQRGFRPTGPPWDREEASGG